MPKKQPRNAFYFFMLDYKARCERNGERFPNGLKDVQDPAGEEWKVLPASFRKKYEDKAKEEKARAKENPNLGKVTNMHRSFVSIDKEKQEEEEAKAKQIRYIETTVATLASKKSLADFKFYLVHVNYFCISEGECYHPAEIAVSEFCLGQGITNVYHTIINPGKIPIGYRHDAMQKSETTHKIPLDIDDGERNFYKIWMDIKRFIEPGRVQNGGEYPPLFTMPDNVNLNTSQSAVKSVIRNFCDSVANDSEYEDPDKFPIYSLEKLFYELQNACCRVGQCDEEDDGYNAVDSFPTIGVARLELEKDVFNYTASIACKFHLEQDAVEYCSKSYVSRWVYLICDHCCHYLNIEILFGRHLPENSDTSFQKRMIKEEEEKCAATSKPITWVDHSKIKKQTEAKPWVPFKQQPLPRPNKTSSAWLPRLTPQEPIDMSEEEFPAIPIGRGRGRIVPGGSGRGSVPLSFSDAMKNRK